MIKIFEQWILQSPSGKTQIVTLDTRDVIREIRLENGWKMYKTVQTREENDR